MSEHVKKITEKTLLPVSLVIVLIGGVVWLTTLKSDADQLKQQIQLLQSKQDQYLEEIQSVNTRLSRIEGKLGIYPEDR